MRAETMDGGNVLVSVFNKKTLCCFNALQVCQNTKPNVALVALHHYLLEKVVSYWKSYTVLKASELLSRYR